MPDIEQPVNYTSQIKKIIEGSDFKHTDWGCEDLEEVRKFIRDYYKDAQHALCSYCQNPVSLYSALNCHVEHIVPKSLYPYFMFTEKNLCVICADCNTIKRSQETLHDIPDTLINGAKRVRYPHSSGAFKIVHPHFDIWEEHIERFDDFYVDKSPKGHFTMGACVLNRKLWKFGWQDEIFDIDDATKFMETFLKSTNPFEQVNMLKAFKKKLARLK
jgi:hypothetical protein